jgi:hypothetical protein
MSKRNVDAKQKDYKGGEGCTGAIADHPQGVHSPVCQWAASAEICRNTVPMEAETMRYCVSPDVRQGKRALHFLPYIACD